MIASHRQVPGMTAVAIVTTPAVSAEDRSRKAQEKQDEEMALIIFVFGFFFYFPWFIGLIYWNSKSERARTLSRCCLVGLCVLACCIIMPIIIATSLAARATSCTYNYYYDSCYYG